MEEQTSESNVSIEKLTSQLHELKNQQRKAHFDLEAVPKFIFMFTSIQAKKRESDLTKQLQLSENNLFALRVSPQLIFNYFYSDQSGFC